MSGTIRSYTLSNVTGDHEITATFKEAEPTQTVSITLNRGTKVGMTVCEYRIGGSSGTWTPFGDSDDWSTTIDVASGTSIELEAVLDQTVFFSWNINGSTVDGDGDRHTWSGTVNSNMTITAVEKKKCHIKVSAANTLATHINYSYKTNGSYTTPVALSTSGAYIHVPYGTVVTIKGESADTGSWTFQKWAVNEADQSSNEISITATKSDNSYDQVVGYAAAVVPTYSVTMKLHSVDDPASAATLEYSTDGTNWTPIDKTSDGSTTTVNSGATVYVNAIDGNKYRHYTWTKTVGSTPAIVDGKTTSATITANTVFEVTAEDLSASLTFRMASGQESWALKAKYLVIENGRSYSSYTDNDWVLITVGSAQTIAVGIYDQVAIRYSGDGLGFSDPHRKVQKWRQIDSTGSINERTDDPAFIIISTKTMIAEAVGVEGHIITITQAANGDITPVGPIWVENGGSTELTFTPHDGYELYKVIDNGQEKDPTS